MSCCLPAQHSTARTRPWAPSPGVSVVQDTRGPLCRTPCWESRDKVLASPVLWGVKQIWHPNSEETATAQTKSSGNA